MIDTLHFSTQKPLKSQGFHQVSSLIRFIAITASLLFSTLVQAALPQIQTIADQEIALGRTLSITPSLVGQPNTNVNWSIAYGPDAAKIDQGTGQVTWSIPSNMPSESFYIGVRASNSDGEDIEYFIVHAGVPQVVMVGPSHEIKDFAQALRQYESPGNQFTTPGTTFVLEDGIYSSSRFQVGLLNSGENQMPPSGNSQAFSTIMAENPGQVELRDDASIYLRGDTGGVAYIAIKGFFMNGTNLTASGIQCDGNQSCFPHHLKFIANGVYGDNNQGFGASYVNDVLFENNYVFGGGRTKVSLFRASRVVARRNVARFDWVAVEDSGPQNTFSFYTTVDALAQNNIAVDSDSKLFWRLSEDAGEFGCPVTQGASRVEFYRNIQLNSEKAWGNMDDQGDICVADLNNNVSWDARPLEGHIIARGAVDINHMTIGNINMEVQESWLINGFPANARGMRNSVIHDVNPDDLFSNFDTGSTVPILGRTYPSTGVSHINVSATDSRLDDRFSNNSVIDRATVTRVNPIYSPSNPDGGLKYIVRPEANSNLSEIASDGEGLGATVMTMRGSSGTFWGDPGYNQETNRPIWPFPLQEIIQERMAAMSYTGPFYAGAVRERRVIGTATLSGRRGFATSGQDLTHYIWGYLGNAVPPMNVSAQTSGNQTIVRWDKAPSAAASAITGFKVYDYNANTGQITNPRDVAANQTSLRINDANGRTSYVVTAVHRTNGEGGFSYPSTASLVNIVENAEEPATEPTQLLAPILRVLETTDTAP